MEAEDYWTEYPRKDFDSVIELDVFKAREESSGELEPTKRIHLKKVFFDTGGNVLEMSEGACNYLGLRREPDDPILRTERRIETFRDERTGIEEDVEILDLGWSGDVEVCLRPNDESEMKCISPFQVNCLTNLSEKTSALGEFGLTDLKKKDFDKDGNIIRKGGNSERTYDAFIGSWLYKLLKINESSRGINDSLSILYDPANFKKPLIERNPREIR